MKFYKWPGYIDNKNLLTKTHSLRPELIEGLDYVLLKETPYQKLKDWYGIDFEIKVRSKIRHTF